MENFHGIPRLLRYPLTGKNISWQSQEPQEYQIHEHPESRSRPPIYLGKRILKQTKNLANWKIQRCGCSQRKHSLSLQNSLVWAILTYLLPEQIKRLINISCGNVIQIPFLLTHSQRYGKNTLLFPSFLHHLASTKIKKRSTNVNPNDTFLANTKLVSSSTQTYSSNTNYHQQQSFSITGGKPETPPIPTTETGGFSLVEG